LEYDVPLDQLADEDKDCSWAENTQTQCEPQELYNTIQ